MATVKESSFSKAQSISGGTDYEFVFDAYTIPTGCTFKKYRLSYNDTQVSNIALRGNAASAGWDKDNTNTSYISWTNGGTYKVKVHNSNSSAKSVRVTVTFYRQLDKVVAGNVILRTDRSKTGTSTTTKAIMTDTHFSAGTKITASAFNSAYDL